MALAPVLPVAEGYPELPDREGYEYLDGRWVKIPMANHSTWVAAQLFRRLSAFVEQAGLGRVFPHEFGYQIWPSAPRRYRKPDGSFISTQRLGALDISATLAHVPPDLAIEVMSPTDRGQDIDEKIAEYFDAGVRLVWVLVPRTRVVQVHRPDGTAARLTERDTLTGEDVVLGFSVRVADLFLQP